MPKLSIFLNDDVFSLVELEREKRPEPTSGGNEFEPLSHTIARLIERGSRYEVVRTFEVREKHP